MRTKTKKTNWRKKTNSYTKKRKPAGKQIREQFGYPWNKSGGCRWVGVVHEFEPLQLAKQSVQSISSKAAIFDVESSHTIIMSPAAVTGCLADCSSCNIVCWWVAEREFDDCRAWFISVWLWSDGVRRITEQVHREYRPTVVCVHIAITIATVNCPFGDRLCCKIA